MLRRFLIAGLAAGALVAPAGAQSPRLLMPGVTYERKVELTLHGPVVTHVVTGPRPTGLYDLRPTLAQDSVQGRERLTSMEKRLSSAATVVGVNGDFFSGDGRPRGLVMQDGALQTPPLGTRSSLGVDAAGRLLVQRVSLVGDWRGTGPRRPLTGLNQPTGAGGITLYTSAWGASTPSSPQTVEAVLAPFPATAPNADLTGEVVQIAPGGNRRIPPGGAVLVARGNNAGRLAAEAPVGTVVTVRLILPPSFAGIENGIGGGPLLVRNRKPVFRSSESFGISWLVPRAARTTVGQRADGRLLLVAVDGARPGYSTGLTNFELAQAMVRLGAVTAMGLDGGPSTAMAFEGDLLNRPSDRSGERRIADSLLLLYFGVQAPPPAEEVVSPNGDGIDERQELSYKLVRPSTVTATLTGPDGSVRQLDSGLKPRIGVYRFPWTGIGAGGKLEPEGRWLWKVAAQDDLGRSSEATREFFLNTTLKGLTARSSGGAVRVDLDLVRPARLTVRIESARGAALVTLRRARASTGHVALRWNGRIKGKKPVAAGRYIVRAIAANQYGQMDLTAQARIGR